MSEIIDENQTTVASDKLRGVRKIAKFIGESERVTFYMLETGSLPAGKQGRSWIASKAVLREHYRRIANGSGR